MAQMDAMTPGWIWYAQIGLAIIGGVIGVLIAQKFISKHFEKAGMI